MANQAKKIIESKGKFVLNLYPTNVQLSINEKNFETLTGFVQFLF
ncbi:putative flavoprotein YhiN [Chryseobacterium ginsenosidimutans]|uniref:Flavoprotein YhiN n=1 Tax=Chryseobacterium geocarposphaerae TaxID=1416776 RepID=A0ABU1LA76_9FLAO|nr:putative flavoprotein YhiN [Chryseobacterium geocarposphaerae]MDR6697168.1 putative flavoprotein YhiN [Chryseobacterium ginsenosidimutans]